MIRFKCPDCGEVIQAPNRLKQTEADCCACDHQLVVPEQSEDPLPALPYVDVNDKEEQRQSPVTSAFEPFSGPNDRWKTAIENHRESLIWGLHRCVQCGATQQLHDYLFVKTVVGPAVKIPNQVYYQPATVIMSGGTQPPQLGWACQSCVDGRRKRALRRYFPIALVMTVLAVVCAMFVAGAIRKRLQGELVHYGRILLPLLGGAFATAAAMFLIGAIVRHMRHRKYASSVLVAEHADRRMSRNSSLPSATHASPVIDDTEYRSRLPSNPQDRHGVTYSPELSKSRKSTPGMSIR